MRGLLERAAASVATLAAFAGFLLADRGPLPVLWALVAVCLVAGAVWWAARW